MNAVLERPETKTPFSPYPQAMDEYLAKNSVEIKIIPDEFEDGIEKRFKNIQITSVVKLAAFLDEEIAFWKEHDPKEKLKEFSKITSLNTAKGHFVSAEQQYKANQTASGNSYLSQCKSALSNGILYSKTSLSRFIIENLCNASVEVIRGFKCGILKNKNFNTTSTVGDFEGLMMAMQFRKIIYALASPAKEEIAQFCENVDNANEQYANLNAKYTASFHEHETMVSDFVNKTNTHFEELHTNTEQYFQEKDRRCEELEKLYREKLRLEAPADYWKTLEHDYTIKGRIWLGVSIVSSLLIVGLLIATLAFLPNLFPENSHWFAVFRNSAILTVVTSILVYMVRYFVKIAMSSFHLARDAKERENLSHFYLALIEKGAVSDKERAIILNSLFSRSDSGLLKGDSGPTMSNTPSELIDVLKNK